MDFFLGLTLNNAEACTILIVMDYFLKMTNFISNSKMTDAPYAATLFFREIIMLDSILRKSFNWDSKFMIFF